MAEMQSGILRMTVNLSTLMREAAEYLVASDKGGAAAGVIYGFSYALGYLRRLVELEEKQANPEILLILWALGLVEDPIGTSKRAGTWREELAEYAAELGAWEA